MIKSQTICFVHSLILIDQKQDTLSSKHCTFSFRKPHRHKQTTDTGFTVFKVNAANQIVFRVKQVEELIKIDCAILTGHVKDMLSFIVLIYHLKTFVLRMQKTGNFLKVVVIGFVLYIFFWLVSLENTSAIWCLLFI